MAAEGSGGLPAAFLDVSHSLTGRAWRRRAADEATVRDHQLRLGFSEPLAWALAARGIDGAGAENYLSPSLKALFPDPSSFMDMDRAARLLVDAVEHDRPTAVFADYDVDGASSAAQLVRWFRAMGRTLSIYVPDRITEGYGPSPAAFRRLKAEGAELVVTVDCGAAAHDAIAAAGEIGLEVVVVDHHLMREGAAPAAAAVVNPNRPGCGSGQGVLAAAGVTFVLLAALNREARRRGLFAERNEPDIRQWLDLAAMGAICDVTQLVGFNRGLATLGLRTMSQWRNPGLAALLQASGGEQTPATAFHAGFILGPRINAGGRIGRADLGARLLSTDDPVEARALAVELHALNAERKAVEAGVVEAAIAALERESNFDPEAPVIVVAGDDWHPGVIGIVAGRLRERYRKPAVVIGIDRAADVGRGSGRSQPGINLGRAVQAAYDEGLLMTGGGHAMAAGLTVRPAIIPELRAFLSGRLAQESELAGPEAVEIDALVQPGGVTRDLWTDFQRLAPYGPGNPEPLFALADVRVERPIAMNGGHIRVTLAGPAGGGLKAVAWRAGDSEMGKRLLAAGGGLHVAGRLRPDDWQGRQGVELEIEDVADPRMRPV